MWYVYVHVTFFFLSSLLPPFFIYSFLPFVPPSSQSLLLLPLPLSHLPPFPSSSSLPLPSPSHSFLLSSTPLSPVHLSPLQVIDDQGKTLQKERDERMQLVSRMGEIEKELKTSKSELGEGCCGSVWVGVGGVQV